MKEAKKLILFVGLGVLAVIVVGVLIFVFTRANSNSVSGLTNEFMKSYQKLDNDVIKKIKYEFDDDLTSTQLKKYKEIIKSQYEKMEYSILDIKETDIDAVATVRFSVYDLASAMEKANSYIEVYSDKFVSDGKFDSYKAIDYKLDQLEATDERIEYTIEFSYYKNNDEWVMFDLADATLKKLNGTY